MEEIRRAFADKNFDDEALQFIGDFINEFDDLFGKYVSRDEVIRRIKENLDTIVFSYEFKERKLWGAFYDDKKEIRLAKRDDKEALKGTFFHEMIHCITNDNEKKTTCFSKTRYVEDIGNTEIVTCHGLTEGFTQYVTLIRNAKYAPHMHSLSYPILAEQVGNLVELIGEEEFLDIAFNRPDDIGKALGFENREWELEDFFDAFDDIWRAEDTIIKQRQIKSPEEKLLEMILGGGAFEKNEEKEPERLKMAKEIIVNNLISMHLNKPITTIEEFVTAYKKICKYAKQIHLEVNYFQFEELLKKLRTIKRDGENIEELLASLPDDVRGIIKLQQILEDFDSVDKDGKIELLNQDEFQNRLYDDDVFGSHFKKAVFTEMGSSVMWIESSERCYDLFSQLRRGLSQVIKERGYNIETLAIEDIEFFDTYGTTVFNLYSNTTDECVYLGTFMDIDGDLREMVVCDQEKKEQVEAEYPELNEGIIFITEEGDIISYHGEDEYKLVDWNGIKQSEKVTYWPSKLELLKEQLKKREQNLQKFTQLRAPSYITERAQILVEEAITEIRRIQNKSQKRCPEETKSLAEDVSFEEIEQIISDITNSEMRRRNALEKGVGRR